MTVYVALLRGVNVGGRGKLQMAKLKQTFEELGCEDVRTYINSGNVIFRDRRAAWTNDKEQKTDVAFLVDEPGERTFTAACADLQPGQPIVEVDGPATVRNVNTVRKLTALLEDM